MVIVYCEKCSKRIPEDQMQSGLAVRDSDERYFCKDCADALPKAARLPDTHSHPHLPAHTLAKARPARAARGKESGGFDRNWLYMGGGVFVLIVCVVVFLRSGSSKAPAPVPAAAAPAAQPAAPTVAAANPSVSTVKPAVVAPAKASSPAAPTTSVESTAAQQRQRDSEREFELMRQQRASRMLDDAMAFARANPGDPWSYKDQLERIANSYRGMPPAEEASKLLAALHLPGPRPAPPPPPPMVLPASWTGPADTEGWKPVLDGQSPPFRAVGFGTWKYDNGVLVTTAKVGDQTNFAFADGQVRIRFQVDKSSWLAINFRQNDTQVGYGVGLDRRVLEPLWGKPLELIATCKGPDVQVLFNGNPVPVDPGGRATEGRLHINHAVGTLRIHSIDYRPLDAAK